MTIIKKFEPEEIQKKISKKYFVLGVCGLFMLSLVLIWTNNSVIFYGEKYEKLAKLEKSLKMENQILKNEIAKSSALKAIASKSSELGFSTSGSIQYIR